MNKKNLMENVLQETGANTFCLKQSPYEERVAYISMVISLAWADGSIDTREREIIDTIAEAAGSDIIEQVDLIISETQRFNLSKYDNWVSEIHSEPLKISLLVDMFLTAFADSICMQSETIYMKYIAGKLGITDEIYNIIRRNVEDFLNRNNNGEPALSYEAGVANTAENRPETSDEHKMRKTLNGIMKTLFWAM